MSARHLMARRCSAVVPPLCDFAGGHHGRMSDATETELLLRFLNGQRRHVLGILEDLPEEHLRRPVLPSGWNCLGLVKHLALSDEHYWFRSVVGGEPFDFFPEGQNGGGRRRGIDFPDLRYIMLHVITETSVHAGHLDAVRELIDGRQWIVL
jgi:Protein of unknown function (DUF664)